MSFLISDASLGVKLVPDTFCKRWANSSGAILLTSCLILLTIKAFDLDTFLLLQVSYVLAGCSVTTSGAIAGHIEIPPMYLEPAFADQDETS